MVEGYFSRAFEELATRGKHGGIVWSSSYESGGEEHPGVELWPNPFSLQVQLAELGLKRSIYQLTKAAAWKFLSATLKRSQRKTIDFNIRVYLHGIHTIHMDTITPSA